MRQRVVHLGEVLLIDDSYNASPQSMAATFDVLVQVGGARRRILVLGEMRELGSRSPEFHRQVGQRAAELAPAFLLAVGPQGRSYLEGAAAAGLPAAAMAHVEAPEDAVPILRRILQPGDALVVKGSRAIGMERVVEAVRPGAPASRP
jgi:UDP-N-acetylmuramoyl-tripeptide--D-alanyl-D-alanine ligase